MGNNFWVKIIGQNKFFRNLDTNFCGGRTDATQDGQKYLFFFCTFPLQTDPPGVRPRMGRLPGAGVERGCNNILILKILKFFF